MWGEREAEHKGRCESHIRRQAVDERGAAQQQHRRIEAAVAHRGVSTPRRACSDRALPWATAWASGASTPALTRARSNTAARVDAGAMIDRLQPCVDVGEDGAGVAALGAQRCSADSDDVVRACRRRTGLLQQVLDDVTGEALWLGDDGRAHTGARVLTPINVTSPPLTTRCAGVIAADRGGRGAVVRALVVVLIVLVVVRVTVMTRPNA